MIMQKFTAAISGLLFGAGLTISGMVNPMKVLNFLDLLGTHDFTLAFVMGGGLLTAMAGYALECNDAKGLRVRLMNAGCTVADALRCLDANWMVRHGIPTVTLGAGQNDIHTVKEWVDVPEFLEGCRAAVALASG